MLRANLEKIFAENSLIRAVNKNNASNEDFVACGFIKGLVGYLLHQDTELNLALFTRQYKIPLNLLNILLSAPISEALQVGNCDEQANLAVCKLLASQIDTNVTILRMSGKGRLNHLHSAILDTAPQIHFSVLVGADKNDKGGFILDTWAFQELRDNPGVIKLANEIGLKHLPSLSIKNYFSNDRLLRPDEIQHIKLLYKKITFYLTAEKLNAILPFVRKNAIAEFLNYFPASRLPTLQVAIDHFLSEDNIKTIRGKLIEAYNKWSAKFEAKLVVSDKPAALFALQNLSPSVNSSPSLVKEPSILP